jgi:hypothetical protein
MLRERDIPKVHDDTSTADSSLFPLLFHPPKRLELISPLNFESLLTGREGSIVWPVF